ncbi:MAG: class I SAM-dependent methyltransferase [Azospirillaceae bacterium]|nr:class I SAM-dependent methyltransferase [Azospirillaceae bacterium]
MNDHNGAVRYNRELSLDDADPLARFAKRITPAATVLDLGCGPGVLGRFTTALKPCVFDAVEGDPAAAAVAQPHYRDIVNADLQTADLARALPDRRYDFIVLADVLEHLEAPGRLLRRLPPLLNPDGRLLISIPNVGYAGLVSELLAGRFEYRSCGLIDRTHVRFFTRASLYRFLALNGFAIAAEDVIVKQPAETEFGTAALDALAPAVRAALLAAPDAMTFQFLVEAIPAGAPAETGDLSQALIQGNLPSPV